MTGAPIAVAKGVDPQTYEAGDADGVIQKVLGEHLGGRVLVIGHSNTVDEIAAAIGETDLTDLGESHFDRLFIVHRAGPIVHLNRLRYGAATP